MQYHTVPPFSILTFKFTIAIRADITSLPRSSSFFESNKIWLLQCWLRICIAICEKTAPKTGGNSSDLCSAYAKMV